MVPDPSNGYKTLSESEICDCLRQRGFAGEDQMHVPQPARTVNAASPVPISSGLSEPVELLSEAVPRSVA